MFAFLKRRKGGSFFGNLFRSVINTYTGGLSDALGLTDGHLVDGDPSNGEANY